MHTKLFWLPQVEDGTEDPEDRRARRRLAAGFYAIELAPGARYLRRVANVSRNGLMLESPLGDEQPGQVLELELPRRALQPPMRVRAEVVRVTRGNVGMRRVDSTAPLPLETLGGQETL